MCGQSVFSRQSFWYFFLGQGFRQLFCLLSGSNFHQAGPAQSYFLWLDSSFWHRFSPLGPSDAFFSLCSFSLSLMMTSSGCYIASSLVWWGLGGGSSISSGNNIQLLWFYFLRVPMLLLGPASWVHTLKHPDTQKQCWNRYWLPSHLSPWPTLLRLMLNFFLDWIYPGLECLKNFGLSGTVYTLGRPVCSLSFLLISRI